MIFDLYEDILSHSWHRFYYGVEAETIEEAIEEVKNGKQDCYDSELLYETVIELSPEDNNGNPTREIYDNLNDTLVWDNSSIVNRGDIITQNLRASLTNYFVLWNLNQKSLMQAVFHSHQ